MNHSTIGKRLKRLRETCEDEPALRCICKGNPKDNACQKQAESIRVCNGKCEDCPPSKRCPCFRCLDLRLFRTKLEVTQDRLANAMFISKSQLKQMENGERNARTQYAEYERIYGEDKTAECFENGSLAFKQAALAKPNWCLCRESELNRLEKIFSKNAVTVICADGGVGKTTLATEFLSRLSSENDLFYGTVLFTDKQSFEEDFFIEHIALSPTGEAMLLSYEKEPDSESARKEKRKQFIREKLDRAFLAPVFLLDDFASVGKEIFSLQEKYPNCKFIVTARSVKDIGNNYDDCVLHLTPFMPWHALTLFHAYRKELGQVDAEEFQPIYDFCEGNAEVLYFITQMLGRRPVSKFADFIHSRKFVAENKKDNTSTSSSMAEKLKTLFEFDGFLPSFREAMGEDDPGHLSIRALAVMSQTEMHPIPRESLIRFLTDEHSSEDDADLCLAALEDREFVKSDGRGQLYMHPLMSNALKLNGIQAHVSDEMYLFLWQHGKINLETLYIDEHLEEIHPTRMRLLKSKTVARIKVSEKSKSFASIDGNLYSKDGKTLVLYAKGKKEEAFFLPHGVETIAELAFCECESLKRVIIPDTVRVIGECAFGGCQNLQEVVFSENSQLTEIGLAAFAECTALHSISLPQTLKKIDDTAFDGCESLQEILPPEHITPTGKLKARGTLLDLHQDK